MFEIHVKTHNGVPLFSLQISKPMTAFILDLDELTMVKCRIILH